jgi:3-hydroxybutyryl-CoA dehydrogenase
MLSETLTVADLPRIDAGTGEDLAAAVVPPAGRLVEPARPRVVLEYPERGLVEADPPESRLEALEQAAPCPGAPGGRLDVNGVDLTGRGLGVLVPARPTGGEPDDAPLDLGDEDRLRVFGEQTLGERGAVVDRQRSEILGREDVRIGLPPRFDVDASNLAGVRGPGRTDDCVHRATLPSCLMRFGRVLVVGAGQMGGGIAQVVAASGRDVLLHDAVAGAAERSLGTMRKSLEKLAEKGGPDPDGVLSRVEVVDGVVGADLLIEAVVEDAAVKEAVFREADAALPENAILASNTSSIPITSLGAATDRADRVVGMHFFNPVPLMGLVEVVRGLETSDETAAAITELAGELGKTAAEARDFPGFVSNRILMPLVNEAAYALMEGVAEVEAIDTIAHLGFNHPMGPLALADLIGLDTCVAIMEVLHAGLGNPKYAPCPLLRQYVQAGRLGRKSGRGFYRY